MKKIFIISLLILSILVLFNCNKKNKIKVDSNMSIKNEYVEKLKTQIDEWSLELDKLDAKVQKLNGDIKINAEKQISSIRYQRDELNKNLEKIQNSTDNSWEDLKNGAEEAKNKISEAFSKAQAEFK